MIAAMTPLTAQQQQEIEKAIFAGRKIEAVKLYRDATDLGLAEAKRVVEDLEVDLRRRSPENFIVGANKKGCTGVLVCVALIATAAVLFSFVVLRL